MKRRKRYTPNQKAAIVLEVLREERSISQIASEYGVHPNLIYKWKKEGLENFHEVYEDHKQEKRVIQERHQAEKEIFICTNWTIDHPGQLAQKKIWH